MTEDATEDTLGDADRATEAEVHRLVNELGAHYEGRSGIQSYTAEAAPSKHQRRYRALVAAAAIIVLALTIATLATRSGTTVDSTAGQTEQTSSSLAPRFGTMPHFPRGEPGSGESGFDPALVPEYISVVDGRTRSNDIVGYIKSSMLIPQGQPIPPSEQPPGTAMSRLYDTSLNIVGYYLPGTGVLTIEEAEAYLETPDYYVDPNS